MEKISVRIESIEDIAEDIKLLRLAPDRPGALPPFEPGSHVDLYLAPGLTRQYSLCGVPGDATYTVAVKLEPASRGGSRAVHQRLRPGAELQISAPRNNFPMAEGARHSVLFAGGIGITPLIGMARALAAADRSLKLLYFSRSSRHAAFRAELEHGPLAPASRFFFGLERARVEEVIDLALDAAPADSHLYICGPAPFMETVRQRAGARGFPDAQVHLEYFAASTSRDRIEGGEPFEVELARSGRSVDVPAGVTIIDVLRRHGLGVETSCEQGVCGTCVTRVLDGEPDHHDSFLSRQERERGDCIAICVSRSRSPRLVLDL